MDWIITGVLAIALMATFLTAFNLTVIKGGEKAEAPAAERPAPPAEGGAFQIRAIPTLKFDLSVLEIPANVDVTILFINQDTGVPHNFSAYTDSSAKKALAVGEICTAPCQNSVTINVAPGTYFFRCDIHPVQMTGKLVAR